MFIRDKYIFIYKCTNTIYIRVFIMRFTRIVRNQVKDSDGNKCELIKGIYCGTPRTEITFSNVFAEDVLANIITDSCTRDYE